MTITLSNLDNTHCAIIFSSSIVLEKIGFFADFRGSSIKEIPNLRIIDGSCNFENSVIECLDNLELINGSANFQGSKVRSLHNLKFIKGNAYFDECPVFELPSLVESAEIYSINEKLKAYIDKNFVYNNQKYVRNVKKIHAISVTQIKVVV